MAEDKYKCWKSSYSNCNCCRCSTCWGRCLTGCCGLFKLAAPFLLLFIGTFLLIMPLVCNNIRNTLLYNKSITIDYKEEERRLVQSNDVRLRKARDYLLTVDLDQIRDTSKADDRNKTRIELIIVTQSRNRIGQKLQHYKPNYLTQVVAKWIKLLQKAAFNTTSYSVRPSVCNVDEDPKTYFEANEIAKYIHMVTRFENKSSQVTLSSSSVLTRKTKEKEDFVFCHKTFLRKNPDYLLVVEDDALPRDDFFTVLRHLLDTHLERKVVRGEVAPKETISWIKLYHPEYFSHFVAYEIERVPEWLALSAVLGTILTLLNAKYSVFKGNIYLLWVIFIAYSVLLTVIISRPNIMWLRRFFTPYLYSYYRAPGCCTPGMLYTLHGAEGFTNYLNATLKKHRRYARDQVQDLFVQDSPVKINRYMVQPNLVTHIGLVSSVRIGVDVSRVESKKKL